MKIQPDESMESWANRVSVFETGRALTHIAKGIDTDIVLAEMSRRITDKMLHPILDAIRNTPSNFNVEQNRSDYAEIMKDIGKAADHIDTNT